MFKPGDVYWLYGRQLAGWGPLAPGEDWQPSAAPQQFLNVNTTYAAFTTDARVIDPAGFSARPKEPLGVAAFTLALPSPALATVKQANRRGHKDPMYQAQIVAALQEPRTALRLAFVGANPAPTLVGADQLPERTSYFTGDDPAKWQTDLASYAAIVYQQLYPGIDLQYEGSNPRLKSTYICRHDSECRPTRT